MNQKYERDEKNYTKECPKKTKSTIKFQISFILLKMAVFAKICLKNDGNF